MRWRTGRVILRVRRLFNRLSARASVRQRSRMRARAQKANHGGRRRARVLPFV